MEIQMFPDKHLALMSIFWKHFVKFLYYTSYRLKNIPVWTKDKQTPAKQTVIYTPEVGSEIKPLTGPTCF